MIMTPEAWAALTAIVLPLVAALAANIRLTLAVKELTRQMPRVNAALNIVPLLERRVAKLEGKQRSRRSVDS